VSFPRYADNHLPKKAGEDIVNRENQITPTVNGLYCQLISFWPSAGNDTDAEASDQACVNVVTPRTDPGTYYPVSIASDDYEKGQAATPYFTVGVHYTPPCYQHMYGLEGDEVLGTITYRAAGISDKTIDIINCGSATEITDTQNTNANTAGLNGAGLPLFDERCANATVSIDSDYPSVSMALAAGHPNPQCSRVNAFEVPYTRFYGNDIHATNTSGSGLNGQIVFNTRDTAVGSGEQYAAIAANVLHINTAAFRSSAPVSDLGLAVPNFSNWPNERDISSVLPASGTNQPSPLNIQGNSTSSGYYTHSGNLELSNSGNAIKEKITIRAIGGDVRITTDIKTNLNQMYNHPGGFKDTSDGPGYDGAPVVLIVADGDIYIDSSVHRIDAVLVANGTVYTCATSFSEVSRASWHNQCNSKLTINGAVAASTIRFGRSIGTRLLGVAAEDSASAGRDTFNASNGDINHAAEVINFPAYLYFSTPYLNDTGRSGYQAIFNAAPLL
jgi:hypothetical protein